MEDGMDFRFYIPTKIIFGRGRLETLHLERLPGKKALIVTSKGNSMIKNGYIERLIKQLDLADTSYTIFNEITLNPTRETVMKGKKLYIDSKCDFIIALGGGSCIDASKAIGIVSANDEDLWVYFHGGSSKSKLISRDMVPVVAIPTTAGTGSEANQWM